MVKSRDIVRPSWLCTLRAVISPLDTDFEVQKPLILADASLLLVVSILTIIRRTGISNGGVRCRPGNLFIKALDRVRACGRCRRLERPTSPSQYSSPPQPAARIKAFVAYKSTRLPYQGPVICPTRTFFPIPFAFGESSKRGMHHHVPTSPPLHFLEHSWAKDLPFRCPIGRASVTRLRTSVPAASAVPPERTSNGER